MLTYIIVFSFLAGLTCALGLGGGMILIVLLTNILSLPQLEAQGINLLFFIPCSLLALIKHAKSRMIDFSRAIPLSIGGVAGTGAGFIIAEKIPSEYLPLIFGVFTVIFGTRNLILAIKKRSDRQ